MREEIVKNITDSIRSHGLGNYILYDRKGNKTYEPKRTTKIFVVDYNCLISIGEKNLTLILMNDDLLNEKKEFFEKLKKTAVYYGKIFRFENMNRKFEVGEFSNFNENINKINRKSLKGNYRMLSENKKTELNPEEKKWLSLLLNIYEYSSGGSFNKNDVLKNEKEFRTFANQAKRLASGKISRSKAAKPIRTETKYSANENVRKNQILYDYYSSLSQILDSEGDEILGNIVSRVADHFFFKFSDLRTTYNENSANFKALIRFVDHIGKLVGFEKNSFVEKSEEMFKNSFRMISESLFKWFDRFKIEKIFLVEDSDNQTSEAIDPFKGQAVSRSSEKMVSFMSKFGSPREEAFRKALKYVLKYGIDEKEALIRAGLPATSSNIDEIRAWLEQAGVARKTSPDKYDLMYKKLEKKGLPKEPVKQARSQILSPVKKK